MAGRFIKYLSIFLIILCSEACKSTKMVATKSRPSEEPESIPGYDLKTSCREIVKIEKREEYGCNVEDIAKKERIPNDYFSKNIEVSIEAKTSYDGKYEITDDEKYSYVIKLFDFSIRPDLSDFQIKYFDTLLNHRSSAILKNTLDSNEDTLPIPP